MECKELVVKTGAWSTALEDRVGHASGKVGEKRRFDDTGERGGCGEEKTSFVRGSRLRREGTVWEGNGQGGGRRRSCDEGG